MARCTEKHPSGETCCKEAGHEGKHTLDPVQHRCHARGCTTATRPEMLMCLKHWRMVPRPLQRAVWASYRAGQCDDKRPSGAWHDAADAAIRAVAAKEVQP